VGYSVLKSYSFLFISFASVCCHSFCFCLLNGKNRRRREGTWALLLQEMLDSLSIYRRRLCSCIQESVCASTCIHACPAGHLQLTPVFSNVPSVRNHSRQNWTVACHPSEGKGLPSAQLYTFSVAEYRTPISASPTEADAFIYTCNNCHTLTIVNAV
jgi:hypothetical protein